MRPWTQKSALIQLRTSLRKCLKNGVSKGPRWLYSWLQARDAGEVPFPGARGLGAHDRRLQPARNHRRPGAPLAPLARDENYFQILGNLVDLFFRFLNFVD